MKATSMNLRILSVSIAALFVATAAWSAPSHKQARTNPAAESIAAPDEAGIRTFTYSPDVVFNILTTNRKHVHVQFEDGEGMIETPVLGDTVQWRAHGGPRNLYIKPTKPGLDTTMTVVTNRRTYTFKLTSVDPGKTVFQKVTFEYPDTQEKIRLQSLDAKAADAAESNRLSGQVIEQNIDLTALNYDYDISGEASFRPIDVSSDHRFMYLRMPQTQAAPSVFVLDKENRASLVVFRTKGQFIIVERLADALLLKIGDDEVRIQKRSAEKPKRPFWASFGVNTDGN